MLRKPTPRYGWHGEKPEAFNSPSEWTIAPVWSDPDFTPPTGYEIYGDIGTTGHETGGAKFMKWYAKSLDKDAKTEREYSEEYDREIERIRRAIFDQAQSVGESFDAFLKRQRLVMGDDTQLQKDAWRGEPLGKAERVPDKHMLWI